MKIKTLQSKPDTFQSKLDTLQSKLNTLQSKADTIESKSDTGELKSKTVESNPETLQSSPETIKSNSDTIKSKPDTLELKDDTGELKYQTVESKPETVESNYEILELKDGPKKKVKVFLYTTFALVAFAFNSILCRLALRGEEIDAASFTGVRLASGALTLIVVSYFISKCRSPRVSKGVSGTRKLSVTPLLTRRLLQSGSWPSAVFLFAYAICFSFAYLNLTAGTGALILFGSVQMSMMIVAVARGERPRPLEWLGLVTALSGLVYLVFPGLASPPLYSSLLMAAAGASWGLYTLRGKSSGDPLAHTTGNFVRTLPFAALAVLIFIPQLHLSNRGIILAVLSGSIASGIGYTVWYAALKHHTATRSAVLQLAVPVFTACIGVLFLAETAAPRLLIEAAFILGGIALTIFGKKS